MSADEQDPKGSVGKARIGKPQKQSESPPALGALEAARRSQFDARQERIGAVRRKGLGLGEGEPSAERTALEAAENAVPPTECREDSPTELLEEE